MYGNHRLLTLHSFDSFNYLLLFALQFHVLFFSSENHVSPDVLILNIFDKLKEEKLLRELRISSVLH